MSDDSSCLAVLCGACGLAIFSALGPWCNQNAFGSNGCCGGQRGCCGSCFDGGFNKDSWEEEETSRAAKQAGPTPGGTSDGKNVAEQPEPVAGMMNTTATEGNPAAAESSGEHAA